MKVHKQLTLLVFLMVFLLMLSSIINFQSAFDPKISAVIENNTTSNNVEQEQHHVSSPTLQNMSKGKGVILFFHIPKTGGSAIREGARRNAQQLKVHKSTDKGILEKIDMWTQDKNFEHFQGENSTVKFVEFHWQDGAVPLEASLKSWRQNAADIGLPFFVFTIMRDPLALYISTYNYFCIFLGKANKLDCPGPYGVDNMLEIAPDNPQGRWLCHGTIMFEGEDHNRPIVDCVMNGTLDRVIFENFDHIGFQEKTGKTVQIFKRMGINIELKRVNKSPHGMEVLVSKKKINSTALTFIQRRLTVDEHLLATAKKMREKNELFLSEV